MRVTRSVETVRIAEDRGRTIDAAVRVRGIDARAGGRGFIFERRDPVEIVVTSATGEYRQAFPATAPNLALAAVAPVVLYAVTRTWLRRKRGR